MAEAVLLTGATGFVGRAVLAELVRRGVPVHAVSRTPKVRQPGVVWHVADLLHAADRDKLAAQCPACRLIHCAWDVEHGAFWTSPANAVWRLASLDLARRFLEHGGRRILALGTCAEYDAHASGPWTESRPIMPTTPYGEAKAALHDDLAEIACESLIWARLFHLYGPGEDRRRLVPSLIDTLRAGRVAEVRAAALVRDFASSAHVARSLVALLEADAAGPFDIGSGNSMRLAQLGKIVAAAVDRPGLLRMSHYPSATDPLMMAPELGRLFVTTSLMRECPFDALHRHVVADCAHDHSAEK